MRSSCHSPSPPSPRRDLAQLVLASVRQRPVAGHFVRNSDDRGDARAAFCAILDGCFGRLIQTGDWSSGFVCPDLAGQCRFSDTPGQSSHSEAPKNQPRSGLPRADRPRPVRCPGPVTPGSEALRQCARSRPASGNRRPAVPRHPTAGGSPTVAGASDRPAPAAPGSRRSRARHRARP